MLKIEKKNYEKVFSNAYSNSIELRFRKVINSGLSKTKNRKAVKLTPNEKKRLNKFCNTKFIKFLITSSPKTHQKIIAYCKKNLKDFHNKNSNVYKILYNVFVSNGYDNIDKYSLIKEMGLKSCPYCNRTYTYTIDKNKKLKPEIDHFYPKSRYPYLAISYYNLIPSCPTCNGLGAKGNNDSYEDKLLSPYNVDDDSFRFEFDISSVNIVNGKIDESSIDINLITKHSSNNKYFQLENLYKNHKDIVIELYRKRYQENTKEHFQTLIKSLNDLELEEDEIYKLITGAYKNKEDFHRRTLNKFINDISRQLENISP